MKELIARIKAVPWIAHLLRANERFTVRLGNQFGAAITYFSVLALVPILMFGLSVLGFVLTAVPALEQSVRQSLADMAAGLPGDLSQSIDAMFTEYLANYAGIGVVGLLGAMYAGAGWMGNLKDAVRAQWRPEFELAPPKRNIVVETLINLAILLALLVMILITAAISSVATSLSDTVAGWLGLDQVPGGVLLVRLPSILVSVAVGWLLFMFLYAVLPQEKISARHRMKGSLLAAIGLAVLQYLTGILFGLFAGNAAAAVFGPVIVLMLFLNLFARLILFTAAWIATTEQPALGTAEPAGQGAADADADGDADGDDRRPRLGLAARQEDPTAKRDREVAAAIAAATPVDGAVEWRPGAGQDVVPQAVAAKSLRLGMTAGYVTGAATGVGVGAMVAGAVGVVVALFTRRRKT